MKFKSHNAEFPFEVMSQDIIHFLVHNRLILGMDKNHIFISHSVDEQLGQFLKEHIKKNKNLISDWLEDDYPDWRK